MSSDKIPGVPEGWELVRIGHPVIGVDCVIDYNGDIVVFRGNPNVNSGANWPIIRKIEKPAAYRPFKDAGEYMPHWGKPIVMKGGTGFDSVVSTSRIGVYVAAGSSIIRHAMVDAFKLFEFADGTPFGVKIDE
jgi:hypothetical protein